MYAYVRACVCMYKCARPRDQCKIHELWCCIISVKWNIIRALCQWNVHNDGMAIFVCFFHLFDFFVDHCSSLTQSNTHSLNEWVSVCEQVSKQVSKKNHQQHRIQCWLYFHNETAKSNYFDFGRFSFLLVFAHSIETKTHNSKNEMDLSEIRAVVNIVVVAGAIAVALFLLICWTVCHTHTQKQTHSHTYTCATFACVDFCMHDIWACVCSLDV